MTYKHKIKSFRSNYVRMLTIFHGQHHDIDHQLHCIQQLKGTSINSLRPLRKLKPVAARHEPQRNGFIPLSGFITAQIHASDHAPMY